MSLNSKTKVSCELQQRMSELTQASGNQRVFILMLHTSLMLQWYGTTTSENNNTRSGILRQVLTLQELLPLIHQDYQRLGKLSNVTKMVFSEEEHFLIRLLDPDITFTA